MDKPSINLNELSIGKLFQVNPVGQEPMQFEYGGDFLVATEYMEHGVKGYLATVTQKDNLVRVNELAFISLPWRLLECVGSVEWFKQTKETEYEQSNMHGNDGAQGT